MAVKGVTFCEEQPSFRSIPEASGAGNEEVATGVEGGESDEAEKEGKEEEEEEEKEVEDEDEADVEEAEEARAGEEGIGEEGVERTGEEGMEEVVEELVGPVGVLFLGVGVGDLLPHRRRSKLNPETTVKDDERSCERAFFR